ncbi:MAG TPA: tetratricopeptide repeat protein [Saprospiraceae bacterium]|nr:tetratricopeptide repeat protein [Saprospiraceae bacterium]HMQ81267.1 tetratricopeptide repeat protein [Saprospiraceae bacterium]
MKKLFFYWTLVSVVLLLPKPDLQAQQSTVEEAQQLAARGAHIEAEQLLTQLLSQNPDYLPAQLLLAHNQSWQRKYKDAINGYRQVLTRHPEHTEATNGLAYTQLWSGDMPSAIANFEKILLAEPQHQDAQKGLGYAYLQLAQAQEAIAVFTQLTQHYPDDASLFVGLGQAYLLENQNKAARRAFTQALLLEPKREDAQGLLLQLNQRGSLLELDVWGGYSQVADESEIALRQIQLQYQFSPRTSLYTRYDNSLSLDNVDFLINGASAASWWFGTLLGWNDKTATRLEAGMRFFEGTRDNQTQFKMEQVFYLPNRSNIRVGGYMGVAADFPTEGFGFVSGLFPLGEHFSLEPAYFYSIDGLSSTPQHRGVFSGRYRTQQGLELTVGGFYGQVMFEDENITENKLAGLFALGLIPLSDAFAAQLAINYEDGIFQNAFIGALGIKWRLNR